MGSVQDCWDMNGNRMDGRTEHMHLWLSEAKFISRVYDMVTAAARRDLFVPRFGYILTAAAFTSPLSKWLRKTLTETYGPGSFESMYKRKSYPRTEVSNVFG